MTKISMTKITLAAGLLAVSAAAAFGQAGTVNGYTPADEAKAKAALTAAGFTPGKVTYAQNGSLFVNASKGGDNFLATVLPDGTVHAGTKLGAVPMAPTAPMSLPAGTPAPPPGRGGGRGAFSGGD